MALLNAELMEAIDSYKIIARYSPFGSQLMSTEPRHKIDYPLNFYRRLTGFLVEARSYPNRFHDDLVIEGEKLVLQFQDFLRIATPELVALRELSTIDVVAYVSESDSKLWAGGLRHPTALIDDVLDHKLTVAEAAAGFRRYFEALDGVPNIPKLPQALIELEVIELQLSMHETGPQ
jgi:hypothetical protein